MGRKKALTASQAHEPFELKPFCYYCEREFDSDKTLIQHQRTKHFNCAECGLKFDTVTGLRVHMLNAYKKTMKEVPNSIPGRENPDIVVHGMEGLPKGVIEEKTKKAFAEKVERDRAKEEETRERQKAQTVSKTGESRSEKKQTAQKSQRAEEASQPAAATQERQLAAFASNVSPVTPMTAPNIDGATSTTVATDHSATAHLPPAQRASCDPQGEVPSTAGGSQLSSAGMLGVSPRVAQLLSGEGAAGGGSEAALQSLVGYVVPVSLARLHPVALQVLATAGVLMPKGNSALDMSCSEARLQVPPQQVARQVAMRGQMPGIAPVTDLGVVACPPPIGMVPQPVCQVSGQLPMSTGPGTLIPAVVPPMGAATVSTLGAVGSMVNCIGGIMPLQHPGAALEPSEKRMRFVAP